MPSTNAITNITDIDELFARIEEYLTPEQVAFVRKAYELAAKAHAAQTRKSGEPYIIHPIGVVSILVGLQMDDKTLAAAFCTMWLRIRITSWTISKSSSAPW